MIRHHHDCLFLFSYHLTVCFLRVSSSPLFTPPQVCLLRPTPSPRLHLSCPLRLLLPFTLPWVRCCWARALCPQHTPSTPLQLSCTWTTQRTTRGKQWRVEKMFRKRFLHDLELILYNINMWALKNHKFFVAHVQFCEITKKRLETAQKSSKIILCQLQSSFF